MGSELANPFLPPLFPVRWFPGQAGRPGELRAGLCDRSAEPESGRAAGAPPQQGRPSPCRSRESYGPGRALPPACCGHGAGRGGADAAAAARGRLWPGWGLRPHRAPQDAPGVSEARPVSGGADGSGPSPPRESGAAAAAARAGFRVGARRGGRAVLPS